MSKIKNQLDVDIFQKVEKAIDLAMNIVNESKGPEEAEIIEAAIYESLVELTESLMLYSIPTGGKGVVQ